MGVLLVEEGPERRRVSSVRRTCPSGEMESEDGGMGWRLFVFSESIVEPVVQ